MSETTQKPKISFGKKLLNFLRSMRFGMILLALILILALIGSLVEQGKEAAFYPETYGWFGNIVTALGWDHIYTVWYFAVLFGLLCINLLFCSVLRGFRLKKAAEGLKNRAAAMEANVTAKEGQLNRWLKHRKLQPGDVWVSKGIGFYGSFITHLGLLLLILSSAATLTLHTDTDIALSIGESKQFGNVTICANSFRTGNDAGETDYVANITITDAGGNAKTVDLSVNHPTTVGNLKFYQSSYNFEGIPVEVATSLDGETETILFDSDAIMNGLTFLTLDGTNGIELEDIYANVMTNEDGSVTPLSSSSGNLVNPAYLVGCIKDGQTTQGIVYPGTTLEAGGVYATFGKPQYSPVLMIKESPAWVLPVLYSSFAILLIGFFLCFCIDPVAVSVKQNGLAVVARKSTEDAVEKINDQIREENNL